MNRMQRTSIFFLTTLLGACNAALPTESSSYALGEDAGARFENVPGDDSDPFQVALLSPLIASRLHACGKLPYETLGNVLASRGVNLNAVAAQGKPPTAGQLYKAAGPTMGAPNYATRTRELASQTTSGATKTMDVFLIAAPEIIAAMPSLKACQVNGQPARMFDLMTGNCTYEGVMCLTGTPASAGQVDLCNQLIKDVPAPVGQQIAVAAILSAAYTCE